jgi:predicted CoA-binding protein
MSFAAEVKDEAELAAIVRGARTVAVVGMVDESRSDRPAFRIPRTVQELGVRVIPVNPTITSSLGETAYPDLASVPTPFDVVDVFQRSEKIGPIADAILALPLERRPRVVWLQSGIRNDEAAARLAEAGIQVVQDRCLGVYASRYRKTS